MTQVIVEMIVIRTIKASLGRGGQHPAASTINAGILPTRGGLTLGPTPHGGDLLEELGVIAQACRPSIVDGGEIRFDGASGEKDAIG